jgi:hypothetical protein
MGLPSNVRATAVHVFAAISYVKGTALPPRGDPAIEAAFAVCVWEEPHPERRGSVDWVCIGTRRVGFARLRSPAYSRGSSVRCPGGLRSAAANILIVMRSRMECG